MDMEFRVYRGDHVIFRALFKWPEEALAGEVYELRRIAHEQFRQAFPAVEDDEVEEHWARPEVPD
jgi:hypothetical protein